MARQWAGLARFLALALLVFLGVSGQAAADPGAWLDEAQPVNWNNPGMALPSAVPAEAPIDPRAAARERLAETPEDRALAAAGWRLFAPYQAGWGVKVIQATSSYDGMGRPWDYQAFVFVEGAFAGTLSPEPMDSRTDGALDRIAYFGDTITAEFRRYAAADPLCCPSGQTAVQYRIQKDAQGPLVVPVSANTSFTPPAGLSPAPSTGQAPGATPGSWETAFQEAHGRAPNDQDRADRAWSLEFLGRNGRPPTDAEWRAHSSGELR